MKRRIQILLAAVIITMAGFSCGGLPASPTSPTAPVIPPDPWVGTKHLGVSSKSTTPMSGASDPSGNMYVGGTTDGGLDGNTLSGTSDFFVTKYNSSGVKQWTKQLGVSGAVTTGGFIAVDASGNVFVSGTTYAGLDGNSLTGSSDFYVTKYNTSGVKQWTKQLGVSTKNTYAYGAAADSSGNVYVAGGVNGGLDGNTLMGLSDFFITKYNSSGTKQWTRQLGVSAKETEGKSVAVDSSGNAYVCGYTTGGLDGNTLTGNYDFFVTKYNASGTKQWTEQLGVAAANTGYTYSYVTIDASGNIFVAGNTTGGLDGNTLTGLSDLFVTKYNSSHVKQWTRQLGVSAVGTIGYNAAVDSAGNVYVGGATGGGLDGNTLAGTQDAYVTKYNASGTKQWTKQWGVSGATTGGGVMTDPSDNVFLGISSSGAIDGIPLTGVSDMYIVKYNAAGVKQ